MSLRQYCFADVMVFIFLAFATSFISEFFYKELPATLVYVNFGLLVSLIVIVRWGLIGVLAYVAAGLPMLIYRSGDAQLWFQIVYYILSNAVLLVLLIFFKWIKREWIHQSIKYASLYLFFAFMIITIFKGVILSLSGINLITAWISYSTAELFNFVMTWIAFIAINQFSEGLIIDMKYYIEQVQGEKKHDAT